MEVKPGYKQTEIGVLPNDWEVRKLSEHFRIYAGGDVPKRSLSRIQSASHPYPIFANALHDRGLYGYTNERRSKEDSLTITARGYLGHAEYRDEPFFPIVRLLVLEPTGQLDSRFTTYAVNDRVEFAIESTGVPQLTAPEVGKYSVAAPPTLPEQRAIATALSDVDVLLGGLDRLIAKKRDLKQAAMQQLLTGQTRLPGFHGEWEVRSLGQLGAWKGGMTPSMQNATYWHGGDFPWISSGDVKVSRLTDTSQHVTSWAVRCGAAVVVPANSLVLVTRSGILRKYLPVALVAKPMAINQDIKALIPTETMTAEYLLHALTGFGEAILARCLKAGTTVESVEFPWLKAFAIPLPPRDEQAVIAAVLSDMDAELAALAARRDKTNNLKQAMMQDLLTGKTRLLPAGAAHA